MSKLITKNFKLHHVRQFIESITEPSNTVYYVFAGNPGGDTFGVGAPPQIVESTNDIVTRIYDVMTHAKRVTSNDVAPMVRKIIWKTGVVYDQYDSDSDLNEKDFFVVTQSGIQNNYYVFKCLYNNNGAISTEQPRFSETSADDPYYETSDGYVWKYLYTIDPYTFNKFTTDEFIPVVKDVNVSANAQPGSIDIIRVNYGGSYYNNWYIGQLIEGDIGFGGAGTSQIRLSSPAPNIVGLSSVTGTGSHVTVVTSSAHNFKGGSTIVLKGTANFNGVHENITILSSTSFRFINTTVATELAFAGSATAELYISSAPYTSYADQFYKNCIMKITSGVARGQYRKILSYAGAQRIATIEYSFDADQDDLTGATYEIYPQVMITPDDRETTNVIARAIVNPNAANSISIIEVLEKGSDQYLATANVYADATVRLSNVTSEANVTIIFPPKGGHGYDPAAELGCDKLGISVKFSNNETQQISTDNNFRTVGILKDPKFFRITLDYISAQSDIGSGFLDGELVYQIDKNYLGGSVSVNSANLEIYSTGTFSGLQISYGADLSGVPTGTNSGTKYYEMLFSNSDIIRVTNVAITAIANGETFANGWMHEGPEIISPGFGFGDPIGPIVQVANSIGGYVRYLSANNINRVANGINLSANGLGYAVGDYFVVDSTFQQDANVVVKTIGAGGAIGDLQVVDGGKVYGNEIAVIDITAPGSGYANGDAVTFTAPYFGSDTATGTVITQSVDATDIEFLAADTITTTTTDLSVFGSGDVIKITGGVNDTLTATVSGTPTATSLTVSTSPFTTAAAGPNIIIENDKVVGVEITNRGLGYIGDTANTQYPTVAFATGAADATGTVKVRSKETSYSAYKSDGTQAFGGTVDTVTITDPGPGIYDSTVDTIYIESPTSIDGNAHISFTNTVSGNLQTIVAIAGNNYGFQVSATDKITVVNSTPGYIRYLNTSGMVASYTLPAGGENPNTSVDSVAATDGTANGGNYDSTMLGSITIENGGIGYTNGSFTVTGSATADYVTNEVGKIISTTITAYGSGYTVPPTITPDTGGIGAIITGALSNTITITSNPSDNGYGAVVYFTNNALGNVATITVANSGFGYLNPPTATIQDPDSGNDHTGSNEALFTITLAGGTDIYNSTVDTITATGPDADPDSTANITNTAQNELSSVIVTNSGAGFYPNVTPEYYIANNTVIDNYTGYGNTRWFSSVAGTIIVRDLDAAVSDNTKLFSSNNDDVLYITGTSKTATANVIADVDGNITGFTLNDSGLGIPDHNSIELKVLNTSNTNVRRLNDTIVDSISITAGGKGYNNNHILIVDSGPGTTNAVFGVTTNVNGELVSFTPIDRGSGQKPAYVSGVKIIAGGTGYAGATATIVGGGGSGATLAFSENSGVIDNVYITNSGVNYNCAPGVTFDAGNDADIQFEVIKPYRLYLYTDSSLNTIAQTIDGSCYELDVNMIDTPTVYANLAYATVLTPDVYEPAEVGPLKKESANLFFIAESAPSHDITITGQYTSFSSSIDADDYVFFQSNDGTDLLQVDSVTNSSHFTVKSYPNFTSNAVALSVVKINAQGYVYDQQLETLVVENASGTFKIGDTVIGSQSKASFPIDNINYNDIPKTDVNINQLFMYKYNGTVNNGPFEENETLVALNVNDGLDGTAKFHSANNNGIYVTSPTGQFVPGETYIGTQSGASFTVNSGLDVKYEGDFVRGSGDIIYIEDLDSKIERANNQSETIKLIVEF